MSFEGMRSKHWAAFVETSSRDHPYLRVGRDIRQLHFRLRSRAVTCFGDSAKQRRIIAHPPVFLQLRCRPPFSTLTYDSAMIAPLSAMQLPVNKITDLYLAAP
jgi:hypothetical protein